MLFNLGKTEGSIDAGQMIKPALARGLRTLDLEVGLLGILWDLHGTLSGVLCCCCVSPGFWVILFSGTRRINQRLMGFWLPSRKPAVDDPLNGRIAPNSYWNAVLCCGIADSTNRGSGQRQRARLNCALKAFRLYVPVWDLRSTSAIFMLVDLASPNSVKFVSGAGPNALRVALTRQWTGGAPPSRGSSRSSLRYLEAQIH